MVVSREDDIADRADEQTKNPRNRSRPSRAAPIGRWGYMGIQPIGAACEIAAANPCILAAIEAGLSTRGRAGPNSIYSPTLFQR